MARPWDHYTDEDRVRIKAEAAASVLDDLDDDRTDPAWLRYCERHGLDPTTTGVTMNPPETGPVRWVFTVPMEWPCGCRLDPPREVTTCADHTHVDHLTLLRRPTADAPPAEVMRKADMEAETAAKYVEVYDGYEYDRDPLPEPDYEGIMERRAERRGRFWNEP